MTGDDAEPTPDGYAAAMAELEALLDELEGVDVDVDVLAARVSRGVELIRFCRDRLDVVTSDVDAVVSELITIDDTSTSEAEISNEQSEAS